MKVYDIVITKCGTFVKFIMQENQAILHSS